MNKSANTLIQQTQKFRKTTGFYKRSLDKAIYKYHLSRRLKVIINSVIIAFPALLQFIFFSDIKYLVSFLICISFLLSFFFLFRLRLMLTFPFVVISFAFSIYIALYSQSPGATAIMAIFNTKLEAIIGFLKSPRILAGLIVLSIILLGYIRLVLMGSRPGEEKELPYLRARRYVLFIMLAASICLYVPVRSHLNTTYPFSIIYNSTSYVKILARMEKVSEREYIFKGTLDSNFRQKTGTFILILGESSRRANWSLYGYRRNTNVFLKGVMSERPRNFILLKDYLSTAQTTYPNMMTIFSLLPSKNFAEIPDYPSFTRIMKRVSFRTYFISTYTNIFSNFISADKNIIVDSKDDLSLLPEIREVLEDRQDARKLIIVHLRDSHLAFSGYEYTYEDYVSPTNKPMVDKYDNSIIHTGEFLKGLTAQVLGSSEPVFAWYMPDHGENLNDFNDGNYGHGTSGFTRYELELPSIMFFNDAFIAANPEIRRVSKNSGFRTSHSNVSNTFLGLSGIYPDEYRGDLDLSSQDFEEGEPYIIDENLFPIRYSKAKIQ